MVVGPPLLQSYAAGRVSFEFVAVNVVGRFVVLSATQKLKVQLPPLPVLLPAWTSYDRPTVVVKVSGVTPESSF
jgi:hypothetical protein